MVRRGLSESLAACVTASVLALAAPVAAQEPTYDLVLAGGRVMDPESGLDAVRHVGITGDRIAALSARPLRGREVIDARGLVVAPGFIDLHAHGQDSVSSRLQVRDGVTTALELEGGVFPVPPWYAEREGRAVISYGATVSHGAIRLSVMQDTGAAVYRPATKDQIDRMVSLARQGLADGALGLGLGIQYTPGATREEILRLFHVAAETGVTAFVHDRSAGLIEPGGTADAVQELIASAAITGASVHMVHVGSSGLGQVPLAIEMLEGARRHGVDITTEVYPYTAASTSIRAAIFDPGWRERLGADYGDIEWVATGERLDSTSFHRYRERGGMIIAHVIPEASVEYAVAHPIVMIASDGVPFVDGRAHPRGAGTFARVLGRYVREKGTLPLMEALRKMTIMPARRLETAVPAMRAKGRLATGADADIVVFDPNTVIDRATFAEPMQPSAGIPYVIVNGVVVVRDGELVEGPRPGRAVRRRDGQTERRSGGNTVRR
jgi:dihydroorotase